MSNTNRQYFYSEEAPLYDKERWSSGVGQYIDQAQKEIVKSMLPDVSGKKILEIGAGTGRFSFLLAEMGAEVTTLDISQEMLDIIKRKTESANLSEKISMIRADASQKIPFSDNSFDFCIAINTLSHIKDVPGLFREVFRILKPGGIFLSNYPNLGSIYFPFGVVVNLRKKALRKNVFTKWYSLVEIKELHKTNEFQIISTRGQIHFSLNTNNKCFLYFLQLTDKIFRKSILKYFAPTIFIKAIRK